MWQPPETDKDVWEPPETDKDADFIPQTVKNIIPDIGNIAKGFGETVKEGAFDMPKRALESGLEMAAGTPYSETPSGKSDTAFIQNAPKMGEEMVRPITHPVEYFKEHPVQQALNILGTAGALKSMRSTKPMAAETLLDEEPRIPEMEPMRKTPEAPSEAPSRLPPNPTDTSIPKQEVPTSPVQSDSLNPLQEARAYVDKSLPKAREFLNKQYAKQAQDPGWANTVAKYLQQESQNMAAKQVGAGPMHVRQLGEEGVQALGQYAIDKGIVSPRVGSLGMKERTNAINKTSGNIIGSLRKEADALHDPVTQPIDVLQTVRDQLEKKYSEGSFSGERESYLKALKDLESAPPTFSGIADAVTKINDAANKANRVKQPTNAMTDVANIASRLNNDRIKQVLGPQKAAIYQEALRDFGATKKLQEFLKRRASRDLSRVGGSTTSKIIQEFMDTVGYKAGSKIGSGMSRAVLKNPSLAKSLPKMFEEFINQVEALDDEMTPGMAQGGVVPDREEAISHFLRKERDPNYQKWLQGC